MTVGKIENGLERGFVKHRLNSLLKTDPKCLFQMQSFYSVNHTFLYFWIVIQRFQECSPGTWSMHKECKCVVQPEEDNVI